MGFKSVCFLEDIKNAYPRLDVVNHENRERIVSMWVDVIYDYYLIIAFRVKDIEFEQDFGAYMSPLSAANTTYLKFLLKSFTMWIS